MDLRLAAKLTSSSPSDVTSQIKINFSMVLNLLLSHTPDQIKDLLKKSFATYTIIEAEKKQSKRKPAKNGREQLWQDFLRHLDFLKKTGYVTHNGILTDNGEWASRLRVDQPLMIAEGFRLGIFPDADPALLAGVIASFVNEQESESSAAGARVPDDLYKSFLKVTERLTPFAETMAGSGFYVRPLFLRPAAAMHAWANGQPWEKVLAIAEIEEGNLAMLILRTADNLRHVRSLGHVFPEAAKSSSRAIDAILRDPVVMEQ
ncbi:MAG: hypothetical protein JRF27_05570 [Deltaproteobacteria bacterium]|nr:hypothetical protein [Deltaproteobacteria bacterium]